MSFFAVLLALMLEQVKPLPRGNVVHDALTAWIRGTARNFDAGKQSHAWVVWSITVLVPTLACCAVFIALDHVSSLARPRLRRRAFSTSRSAFASSATTSPTSAPRSSAAMRSRRGGSSPNGATSTRAICRASEFLRHVIEHSLLAAHRHVFGVFFWFVLLSTFGLGPAGAVLYRLAEFVSRYWAYRSGSAGIAVNERLMALSLRLFHLLDHVPARLTAAGFAVVGNFEEAVNCWRRDASLWKYEQRRRDPRRRGGRGRRSGSAAAPRPG